MKKVVRLTESDLVRLVKRVINEQTDNRRFTFSPKGSVGGISYLIKDITVVKKGLSKIEFMAISPKGDVEKKINIGYIRHSNPRDVYRSETSNDKYGTANIDLIKTIVDKNLPVYPPKPENQPEGPINYNKLDVKNLIKFTDNLINYLTDVSGEYIVLSKSPINKNESKFVLASYENKVLGSVNLTTEKGIITVSFNKKPVYKTTPNDPRGIGLVSKALVGELSKRLEDTL